MQKGYEDLDRKEKMIGRKKIKEEIEDLLEEMDMNNYKLINQFFNLLFWKDYGEGHVDEKDKSNILLEINKATIEKDYGSGNEYDLDTKKILPFINKIRNQLGLKELTTELGDCLMEMTIEVKKEIIMKKLE